MLATIKASRLTQEAFAPYGDVIEKSGSENFLINNGKCKRHHSLANPDVEGALGISIFEATAYSMPLQLSMVERHPLGSQAFYPLGNQDWLVIVCEDRDAKPVNPSAFLASSNQGVNLNKGQWHGVLTPLHEDCDFLVVDRCDDGDNLQEHFFQQNWTVVLD